MRIADIEEQEWADCPLVPERYEISDHGVVRSKSFVKTGRNIHGTFQFKTKPRIMKQQMVDGYCCVELRCPKMGRLHCKVHRLVALAFCSGYMEDLQVNHIDSNRSNNHYKNLEWVTASENVRHSYDKGFASNRGSSHPRAVLTEEVVLEIRSLRDQGVSVKDIAEQVGKKKCTVEAVILGKNWRHV